MKRIPNTFAKDSHTSTRTKPIWKTLHETVDLFSKLAGILAIVVGGWWTYNRFKEYRQDAENIAVTVSADTDAVGGNQALAFVNVVLKNVGRVPIYAEASLPEKRESWKNHSGCEISIIEYDADFNTRDEKNLLVDWEQGGGNSRYIIEDHDILAQYKASKNGNYVLNPGAEYPEPFVFRAQVGKLYAIRARFFSSNGSSNAHIKYILVSPAKTVT